MRFAWQRVVTTLVLVSTLSGCGPRDKTTYRSGPPALGPTSKTDDGTGKTKDPETTTTGRAEQETPDADAAKRRDQQERLAAAEGDTAQLRLLETTDLHVSMEAWDYYRNAPTLDSGLVRAATVIRRARGEVQNSLLIDNGDLLQGNPLGDWFLKERDARRDIHSVYKAMNLLGYDAANLGNHDFNYGLDFLEAALTGAKFPYVSANVLKGEGGKEPFIQPYIILERTIKTDDGKQETIKIGVIGFVPPQIMNWDRSNLLGKVHSADIFEKAKELVPRLKAEGADVVVAVPHSGINAAPRAGGDENAVYYLTEIADIDAILCGHSHQVFPSKTYETIPGADLQRGTIRGVPTVMSGFWGSHVGVVDLSLKKTGGAWHVVSGTAQAREVKTALKPDEAETDVRAAVADDHKATLKYLQTVVGKAEQPITSFFSQISPSTAVQLVQEAQLWYAQKVINENEEYKALRGLPLLSASAPLKAGQKPDNYTFVKDGPLTLANVADLYVYPNTVKVVRITGQGLRDWLEMAASAFKQVKPNDASEQQIINPAFPPYNFDQILGTTVSTEGTLRNLLEYTIDISQPARYERSGKVVAPEAHRIVRLTYKGEEVSPKQEFLVITNNYRANGGGQFPGLDGTSVVVDPGRESREALRDYVTTVGTVGKSLTKNWQLAPVSGATNVVFETGPDAKAFAATLDGLVEYVGDGSGGFAKFRVNLAR